MKQIRITQQFASERSLEFRSLGHVEGPRNAGSRKGSLQALSALALCCALFAPATVFAQAPDSADAAEAAFNSGPPTTPTPISEVPRNEQIPVAAAQFDRGGYLVKEQSGTVVDVPFTNNNLDVMRFGRSTTGVAYLVNEGEAPVLYVPEHYKLVIAGATQAVWQPLPDNFVDAHPVFVSLAATWDEFIRLSFYPGMRILGGVWGGDAGNLSPTPHRTIIIDRSAYSYEDYHSYATDHPGRHLTFNQQVRHPRIDALAENERRNQGNQTGLGEPGNREITGKPNQSENKPGATQTKTQGESTTAKTTTSGPKQTTKKDTKKPAPTAKSEPAKGK